MENTEPNSSSLEINPEENLSSAPPTVRNEKPDRHFPILKYIILGIVFVIILGLIGGAYFMGMNKSKNQQAQKAVMTSPSPTQDPSNRKTYNGDGFSFEYPSFATFKESDEKDSHIIHLDSKVTEIQKDTHSLSDNTPAEDNFYLKISSADNLNNLTPTQFLNNYKNSLLKSEPDNKTSPSLTGNFMMMQGTVKRITTSTKEYNLNEISGIYTKFGHAHETEYVLMSKNNKVYLITYHNGEGDPVEGKAKEYVDQILTSFKFIDSESNMINKNGWKIFKHPDFTLSAPKEFVKDNSYPKNANHFTLFNYDFNHSSQNPPEDVLKIEAYTIDTDKSLENYVTNQAEVNYNPNYKKIKINEMDAYEIIGNDGPGTGYPSYVIKNPNKNRIYSINFWLDFNNYPELRNQILSTFKFN